MTLNDIDTMVQIRARVGTAITSIKESGLSSWCGNMGLVVYFFRHFLRYEIKNNSQNKYSSFDCYYV